MKDATRPHRRPGGRAARTGVAALLAGLLLSVVLAAGCSGNEKTSQKTQRTGKETKKERTQARTGETRGAGGQAHPRKATLEMSGTPGTEFSGSCTVGDEESELSGQVPDRFVYDLDGGQLDCEVSSDDNLKITFTAGKNTSVQQINGGTLNLTYKNGQLSVSSSGSSGQVGSSSSQVSSSSQSSSSSGQVSP